MNQEENALISSEKELKNKVSDLRKSESELDGLLRNLNQEKLNLELEKSEERMREIKTKISGIEIKIQDLVQKIVGLEDIVRDLHGKPKKRIRNTKHIIFALTPIIIGLFAQLIFYITVLFGSFGLLTLLLSPFLSGFLMVMISSYVIEKTEETILGLIGLLLGISSIFMLLNYDLYGIFTYLVICLIIIFHFVYRKIRYK
jgi:hypothetical protein